MTLRMKLGLTFATICAAAVCVGGLTLANPAATGTAARRPDVQRAVDDAYGRFKGLKEGKNADYIPALAKVNPNLYGIALVTVDGRVFTAGDVKSEVSIQSISKVFTMALVMEEQGTKAISGSVGVDATGQPFNSIVAIEQYKGKEMNPMVNPGAITMTSMVKGGSKNAVWEKINGIYDAFAGRHLSVNQEVYASEAATNQRNQAIAELMHAYGLIKENPDQATDVYTRQCSVNVNAVDLATMAATLADGGKNPVTKRRVISEENVPEILAVMATAGLYDDSGKWLFKTGLPAKSGVGGGIIAVAPGRFGIAVISPPLDPAGNSVRAQATISHIATALGANPYYTRPR